MEPPLRLHPGQQKLTPEQEAEAQHFAEARIEAQLSTEPVDEPEAERLLRHVYAVAQLPPPEHICWLDGPLQLQTVMPLSKRFDLIGANVWDRVWDLTKAMVEGSIRTSVGTSVGERVEASAIDCVWERVEERVSELLDQSIQDSFGPGHEVSSWYSVVICWAYEYAAWLALFRFFDVYLAPNELHALAHFNELVSGYWLGSGGAVIVRRPRVLARDHEGRLHSATGKCLEYPDGWGFYAWHGVRVPEKVILAPEQLTREDFLSAPNVEVRRVIQERMGDRFVAELGGQVIDAGPRGTLYEVQLPDDPEQVARYVQVQDASTARQYFLQVPPTVKTAAEAVAWSFQMTVEAYDPAQEM
jgi:hypothetical protein